MTALRDGLALARTVNDSLSFLDLDGCRINRDDLRAYALAIAPGAILPGLERNATLPEQVRSRREIPEEITAALNALEQKIARLVEHERQLSDCGWNRSRPGR